MSFTAASGRVFDTLPIDSAAEFPQRFACVRDGVNYRFTLYVDVPETALGPIDEIMSLPDGRRFLVVRVDRIAADGSAAPVFLRKVVPSLEYRAGPLTLAFPSQQVARRNLNGKGEFGTRIVAGVAS